MRYSHYSLAESLNICGWYLGGVIALEMTYILESMGFSKVNVYLFKAMLADNEVNYAWINELTNYQMKLEYNNVNHYVKSDNLVKYELNCHHVDILEHKDEILDIILKVR